MLPPPYKPKAKKPDIIQAFYADPFRDLTAEQEWTSLGVLLQIYGEIRRLLKRVAPDKMKWIDDNDN